MCDFNKISTLHISIFWLVTIITLLVGNCGVCQISWAPGISKVPISDSTTCCLSEIYDIEYINMLGLFINEQKYYMWCDTWIAHFEMVTFLFVSHWNCLVETEVILFSEAGSLDS